MQIYGLVGHPLSHSRSAELFNDQFPNSKFKELEYRLFDETNLASFIDTVKGDQNICGFNITIPYKQTIIPFLQSSSPEVINTGAANTVKVIREGGYIFFHGHNTDVFGFERSLSDIDILQIQNAIVLGTGGASRSVQFVLNQLGLDVKIISRQPVSQNNTKGYADLEVNFPDNTIVVNCTPVGMYPNNSIVSFPYDLINDTHIFYDLTYNPEKTKFLKEAELRGARIINGELMLKEQAKESWKFWGL